MKNSKINLKKLPQKLLDPELKTHYLTNIETNIFGLENKDNLQVPFIMLKYFQRKFQCFSEWEKEELKEFTLFNEKLNSVNWQSIYNSASKTKGEKKGFGYTVHINKNHLPNQEVINTLSEDLTLFELRVNKKMRVHGFRSKAAFCLLWLDREHIIYKD